MTNYTIKLLKKEEVKILDSMDVMNAVETNSDSQVREELEIALSDIRSTIGLLSGKKLAMVSGLNRTVSFENGEWKVGTGTNLEKYKWDTVKEEIRTEEESNNKQQVFNITINLDSKGNEARSVAKIADEIARKLREIKFN